MSHPADNRTVKAILGPTNTGKTHYAIERMLARPSGVIGLPLRLLAREVYDKIRAIKGDAQCALVTGEEKIVPEHARFYVCTVEAMPMEREFAFVAVDEVQLIHHPERGHVFTDRLLHARGTDETLLLGAEAARPLIEELIPGAFHDTRERFSTLSYAGPCKLTRLPKRSVVVAFSAAEVYSIAELIRRYRGGAAVVMGALSPRTRNAQAEMFQSGEVDFLVATDAIGMGLNLDTDHVAFASMRKFDGARRRRLTPMEAGQIAGRAGRFRNDGTFGPTGDCLPFDEEMVAQIENHRYEPYRHAIWRNSALRFDSLEALTRSLNRPPPHPRLRRVVNTEDEAVLERLSSDADVRDSLARPHDVKLFWEVCQIPDFRNLAIDSHVRLLGDIYNVLLRNKGRLPFDYLGKQVARLDHVDGDVDILSSRLAQIRTWTYCSHKSSWLDDHQHWVERTRAVEDRLSDALHERLMARFVDRRTSALLKGVGGLDMEITIKDNGDVWTEEHKIGHLEGLSFNIDSSDSELEAKALAAAAEKVVGPEINRRLTSLCAGNHAIFKLDETGRIMWGGQAVGRIAKSGSVFNPDAELIGGELGNPNLRNLAEDRMRDFLRAEVSAKLAPLKALKDLSEKEDATPEARGFAFTMLEGWGHVDRQTQRNLTRNLDQKIRRELREAGVFFGQYDVFMPELIKPKPAALLSALVAFGAGGDGKPFIPFAGMTSIANEGELSSDNYAAQAIALAGYKACGPRIIRFDILDRFAGLVRDAQRQAGTRRFQIMQEMLALLGCTYEDVQGVLRSLGYKSETIQNEDKIDDAAAPELTASVPNRFVEDKKPAAEVDKSETAPSEAKAETAPDAESAAASDTQDVKPADPQSPPPDNNTGETTPAKAEAKPENPAPKPQKKQAELHVFQHRETDTDGNVTVKVNNEFWFLPFKSKSHKRKSGPPKGRKGGKKGGHKGPGKPRNKDFSKPRHSDKIDPDSPFAALAALKQKGSNDKDKS